MARSTSISSRRVLLFSTAFAGILISLLSLWILFFSHSTRSKPFAEYSSAALPGIAACSLLLLYRLRRAPGSEVSDEETQTTLADARFLAATESSLDAFFLLDAVRNSSGAVEDFTFTFLNRKARELFGLPDNRGVGDRLCELYPSFHLESLFAQFESAILTGGHSTAGFAIQEKSINARWVRSSVLKLGNGVAVTVSDRTAAHEQQAADTYIAHHDTLTGLPNRALLDDRMQQAIERARRNRHFVALLLLDLDNLKRINAEFGHGVGDYVLNTVAQRVKSAIRTTDSVFRLGSEQFAILYADLPTSELVSSFANDVMASLVPPISWQQNQLSISASIGLALFPESAATAESLLEQADLALYRMKRDGGASAAAEVEFRLTAV